MSVKVGQSSIMAGVTTMLNVGLTKPTSYFPWPMKKFTTDFHIGVAVTPNNHAVIS